MNNQLTRHYQIGVVFLIFFAFGCSRNYTKTIPTTFSMTDPVVSDKVAADSMRISGYVFSSDGLAPVEHVIAMEAGSLQGVFTDEHGGFQLTVSEESENFQLYFKMVGYSLFMSNKIVFSSGSEVRVLLLLGTTYTICH